MLPGPGRSGWTGLGKHLRPPTPHFTSEEMDPGGFAQGHPCPPPPRCHLQPLLPLLSDASILLPGEPSGLPHVVANALRATTGTAHHPRSCSQGRQRHLGSVWACGAAGWLLLVLRTEEAKALFHHLHPGPLGFAQYPTAALPSPSGLDTGSRP